MEIRKFIFSIVTKYDKKGINAANKDAERLTKSAISATRAFEGLARAQLKAAKDAMALASAEGKAAANLERLEREAERSSRSIAKMEREVKKLRTRLKTLQTFNLKAVGSSLQGASDRLGKFQSALAPIGQLARTAATGVGLLAAAGAGLATTVIRQGAAFESLRARLKTTEGSVTGANVAFQKIKDFASTTPFEVENLTEGFTQLRVRGVQPTTETLTGLGDLASAFGQDFTSVTESIGAAARGELDPIEKFGISAKIAGDRISLSFKDQTVEVNRSAEAVTNALVAFGQMEGVQGAMADQSATTSGAISNFKDTISNFLDQIAQMGVLEEFNKLLADISSRAGEEGLAKVIADVLVKGLKTLREALANITQEDIEGFFKSAMDVVDGLASALGAAVRALELFSAASGDAEATVGNLALAMTALIALFAGPAGLVVAAGAAGAIIGRIFANLFADLSGLNDEIAALEAKNDATLARIQGLNTEIRDLEQKGEERRQRFAQKEREQIAATKATIQEQVGGLGAGLVREASQKELTDVRSKRQQKFFAQQLATPEGAAILEAIDAETERRASAAQQAAQVEAARSGATGVGVIAAGENARAAALAAAQQQRRKALTAATETFAATGSTQKAAQAAVAGLETKAGKKAAKTTKKGRTGGDQFFAFEKEARTTARRRGEEFAATELERLVSEGIAADEALEQAREAGRQRARDLEQRFLEAGKIFEDTSDNVLDILGLRGPGSVLEGRPPPQNLTIAPHVEFTMIGEFNQTIESVESAAALEEITGRAAEAIPAAGLAEFEARMTAIVEAVFNLQVNRLIKADAGGKLPPGPQG